MSLPSLPLFPGAYFGDTKHLSCEEHGAYLQLLMIAWQAGGAIPDDDAKIARMVSLSLKRWLSIKPTVMAFWTKNEEGAWVQSRLLKELSWVNSRIEKRRDAGKLGGRPKSLKNKEPSKANGSAPESKTKAPTPTPTPTPTEEEAATAASAGAGARPPSKSQFDEIEATCRDALGKLAPCDLVIGPVVKLFEDHGESAAAAALIDAARSARSPIRTWSLLAAKARERLAAPAIVPFPETNGARHHGPHRPTSTLDVLYRELEHEERAKREAESLRQIGRA